MSPPRNAGIEQDIVWKSGTNGVSRLYKHPRIIDRKITLKDYEGPVRQVVIADGIDFFHMDAIFFTVI